MERINAFFNQIRTMEERKNPYLSLLMGRTIIVFGAGSLGHEVYTNLLKANIKIDYFCSSLNGGYTDKKTDIKVIKQEELVNHRDAIIIMAIGDAATKQEKMELVVEICSMGFKEEQILNHSLFDQKESISNILRYKDEFIKAYQLLEDESSKKIYVKKLDYLVKYIAVDFQSDKEMYLDDEIIQLGKNERIIDAGAFIGDTAEQFLNRTGDSSLIYSFEPDEHNYSELEKRVEGLNQVEIIKKGLWSGSTVLYFSDDQNGSSHIENDGKIKIETIDLDSFCEENNIKPTFIKMDIEGAECEAIRGAKNTIVNYKPQMSICLYHKLEDMFMIPIMIKELDKSYKLYVRHYSDYHTDTVLYAVL